MHSHLVLHPEIIYTLDVKLLDLGLQSTCTKAAATAVAIQTEVQDPMMSARVTGTVALFNTALVGIYTEPSLPAPGAADNSLPRALEQSRSLVPPHEATALVNCTSCHLLASIRHADCGDTRSIKSMMRCRLDCSATCCVC